MKEIAELKVGDTVYVFDNNRRIYRGDRSSPDWLGHWRACKVTGETSRSFVIDDYYGKGGWKIPKNGRDVKLPYACSAFALDLEAVRRKWFLDHAHEIVRQIQYSKDYELLRSIADMIGYEPPKIDLTNIGNIR